MENNHQHIVNQLRLDLEVENQEQSFHVRHQLGSYWEEWVVPEIEKACNALSNKYPDLLIDRLEIDLGELFFDRFEEQFRGKLAGKLADELQKQAVFSNADEADREPEISDLSLLRFFLQTGQYPWWAGQHILDINVIFERVFVQNPEELRQVLCGLQSDLWQFQRLLFQIDYPILKKVLTGMCRSEIVLEKIKKTAAELEGGFLPEHRTEKLRTQLFLILLIHAISPGGSTSSEPALMETNAAISKLEAVLGQKLREKMVREDPWYGSETLPVKARAQEVPEQKTGAEAPEKILTRYAGLILIAPFLPQFFTNTRLLENHAFRNREAKYRAVHLLHYIATGELRPGEELLALGKLLCGVPLGEPVPRETELSETEIAEADDLLRSVLEHWGPLNNTSVAGLRSSFLVRDGILYDEGAQWKLRVDRKSYDVLLQKISWGFAYINFSWTSKPIETEW